MAQRKGLEPMYTFLHNTISNRARSTAPPSLQTAYLLYTIPIKKSTVFSLFSKEKTEQFQKKLLRILYLFLERQSYD